MILGCEHECVPNKNSLGAYTDFSGYEKNAVFQLKCLWARGKLF